MKKGSSGKSRFMKNAVWSVLVSALFVALADGALIAQGPPPIVDIQALLSGPVQIISKPAFDQLVQSGQAKVVSPAVLEEQNLQRLLTDIKSWAVVDAFLDQNPNLANLAQLVNATPTSPDVFPTADGNYRMVATIGNGSQVIETMGQGTVLASLARSIQSWSHPAQQVALYQTLYAQYTTLYNQLCGAPSSVSPSVGNTPQPGACANLTMPSALTNPSALQHASIDVIHYAIEAIGSQGPNLLKLMPPTPSPDYTYKESHQCIDETGMNLALIAHPSPDFGDQTGSSGCTTPSANGILRNFGWPMKDDLTCVRNQGARGSCHIFAATSAVEELIARDTGKYVNLSEQDFMENEKLIWGPSFYDDGGDSWTDLNNAATFKYKFAYELQWDYNPSYQQPAPPGLEYQNSCENYPFPAFSPYLGEPGCSTSAPQAPGFCAYELTKRGIGDVCALVPAPVIGNSPYSVNASAALFDLWDPNPDYLVAIIQSWVASKQAVMLAFNVSHNFRDHNTTGYVAYDKTCDLNKHWNKNPKCATGGFVGSHQVHVVGYISNEDLAGNSNTASAPPGEGGGYFVIKNSWGACYGDAGYAYMPVAYLKATATGATGLTFVNVGK